MSGVSDGADPRDQDRCPPTGRVLNGVDLLVAARQLEGLARRGG